MATAYLYPAGDDTTDWANSTGANHYTEVDDPQGSPDDDSTYINTGSQHSRNTIKVCIKDGANESDSGNLTNSTSWVDRSYQFNDVPGGSGWTVQDLKDIVFGVQCNNSEFPVTTKYEWYTTDDSDIDSQLSGATINHVTVHARFKYTGSVFNSDVHCTQVYLAVDYTPGGPTYYRTRIAHRLKYELEAAERISHRLALDHIGLVRIAHDTDLQAIQIPAAVFVPDTDNGTDSSGTWLRNGGSSSDLYLAIDDRLPLDITDYVYIDSTGVTVNTSQFVTKNTGAATAGDAQPSYQKLRMYIRDYPDSTSLTYTLTPILVKNGTTYLHPTETFDHSIGQTYQISRWVDWDSPPWGGSWGAIEDISFGVRVTAISGVSSGREIRIVHMFLETFGVDALNLVFKPQPWCTGSSTWIPSSGNSTYNALGLHVQDDDAHYLQNVTPAAGEYIRVSGMIGDDDFHPLGTAGYGLRMDVILEQNTTANLVLKGQFTSGPVDSDNQVTVNTTDKQTVSFYWYDAPGGSGWTGVPEDLVVELEVVTGNSGTLKVYQIKFTFFRTVASTRIIHDTVLELPASTRISHGLSFEAYNPAWWDASFLKRAPIEFGTDHDTIPVDYTALLELYTGFEERIATNGVVNESVGSRQIAYHNDGGSNEYLIVTWLAQDPGVANYRIYACKKDLTTGITGSPTLVITTGTSSDTHYIPTVFIDSNGYIHLFYGAHTSPLKYKRSTNPHDISAWTTEVDLESGTYPRPVEHSNGDLYVFMRGSATRLWGWIKSTDGGSTWSSFWNVISYTDPVITGIGHPTSVYCGGVIANGTGRVFACITFWDSYGNENKGRTVTVMYSDDMENWYDMDGNLIKATDGTAGNAIIHADIPASHRIFESGAPFPTTGPFYHTNWEAFVLDSNDYPHFTVASWMTYIREECPVYHAKWNGSSWVTTNLSNLVGGELMYYYRAGGSLYVDNASIYVYIFTRPVGTDGSAELFRYVSYDLGATWGKEYLTKNTFYGVGQISAMIKTYDGVDRWITYCRGADVFLSPDKLYGFARRDGDDIRVVRQQHYNGGSTVDTELDRIPDRFQAEDTELKFAVPAIVPADRNHAHDYDRLWLYYANSAAGSAPANFDNVFILWEGFEAYAQGSQLSSQGGWSSSSPARFIIFQYDESSGAHPNKLYSGIRSLNLVEDTSDAYIEKAFPETHDSHDIFAWLWNEQSASEVYVELYDSTSGDYVSVGFRSECTWRKTGTGWTTLTTAASRQYHQVQFRITSSGVTIFVDGVEQVTNDPIMTEATHIRIGLRTDSQGYCDSVYSKKYLANGPEPVLGTEEGDVNEWTYRGRHHLNLAYERDTRIAHAMKMQVVALARSMMTMVGSKTELVRILQTLNLEAEELERIAQEVVGDKTELVRGAHVTDLEAEDIERIMHTLILEFSDTERIAQKIAGDKTTLERVANKLALESEVVERIVHSLVADKEFVERIMHDLALELSDTERIIHAIVGDKETTTRSVHDVLGDKHVTARIAHEVGVDKEEVVRIMHTLLTDKQLTTRIAHAISGDKELFERIHNAVLLEAEESARIANTVVPDKAELVRIANKVALEQEFYIRLCNAIVLEGVSSERIPHLLELRSVDTVRIVHAMVTEKTVMDRIRHHVRFEYNEVTDRIAHAVADPDKTELVRIPGDLNLEDEQSVRIHFTLATDKELIRRIMNTLVFEAGDTVRIVHDVSGVATTLARCVNLLVAEKETFDRIAHDVPFSGDRFTRIANQVVLIEELATRIRHELNLTNTETVRMVNDLLTDKIDFERIPHTVALALTESFRIAHTVDVAKAGTTRIYHTLRSWKTALTRMSCLVSFVAPVSGVRIDENSQTLLGISIENDKVIGHYITYEDLLHAVEITNQTLIGITIKAETMKAITIQTESLV